MPDDARIPKLTARAQASSVTTLPLDHLEGYVLSRVDGTSTEEELSQGLGMPHDRVVDCLEKLSGLGLVTFQTHTNTRGAHGAAKGATPGRTRSSRKMAAAVPTPPPQPAPRERPLRRDEEEPGGGSTTSHQREEQFNARSTSSSSTKKVSDTPKRASADPPPASQRPLATPAPGSKPVPKEGSAPPGDDGLAQEEKNRIDAFTERLKRDDHYQLLGVDRSSDKKAIKKAYYALAAVFHPDRHFRSGRSVYRARMEEIFHRITEAHDTLLDREKRARYDGSSPVPERPSRMPSDRPSQIVMPGPARTPSVPPQRPSTVANPTASSGSSPTGASNKKSVPPPRQSSPPARPPSHSMPPMPKPPRTPTIGPPSGARAGFSPSEVPTAVKLISLRDAAASRPSVPPERPQLDPQAAVDHLKRRYAAAANAGQQQQQQGGDAQIRKYIELAQAAMAAKDPVSAVNTYRIALSLDANHEGAKKGLEEAELQADVVQYDTNVKRALEAEKIADWVAAAKFWTKATRGQPQEVSNFAKAARALIECKGDLREAARMAKRVVELRQADVEMRLLLIDVYIAAEMWKSGKSEADRALEKWPKNDDLKSRLKTLKSKL